MSKSRQTSRISYLARSLTMDSGVPRRQITCWTMIRATVDASLLGAGNTSAHFENIVTTRYEEHGASA